MMIALDIQTSPLETIERDVYRVSSKDTTLRFLSTLPRDECNPGNSDAHA
jgi:hypothetical protein